MNISTLVWGFFVAFITALFSTPFVAQFAKKKNWIDVPGIARSMHKTKTPRAGGIAIFFAFFVGLGLQYILFGSAASTIETDLLISRLAFPLGCICIVLVGLYDDAYSLGFKKKFLFQGIIAYTMFLAGFRIPVPEVLWLENDPYLQAALGLPLTLFWYILIMNAINLIDGLDGLAGGVSLIAIDSLAIACALNGDLSLIPVAVVVTGALLGFLFHNFNPASIFMGDTGSLFLGFVLATCGIEGSGHGQPLMAAIVVVFAIGFPILDTSLAFTRRILRGGSPFAPDRDHIHHRLIDRFKFSVKGSVIRLYAWSGLFGLTAVGIVVLEKPLAIVLTVCTLFLTCLWLKKLGYLSLFEGIHSVIRRMNSASANKITRGEKIQKKEIKEESQDVSLKDQEETCITNMVSIQVEKREMQDLVIQTSK